MHLASLLLVAVCHMPPLGSAGAKRRRRHAPDDPEEISRNLDRAIAEAAITCVETSTLLPWEKKAFRGIFQPQPLSSVVRKIPDLAAKVLTRPGQPLQQSLPAAVASKPAPLFELALVKPRLSTGLRKADDREGAIRRWLCLLGHNFEASKVGRMLTGLRDDGAEALSQTLSGKATSTLLKRARTCARLVTWGHEQGIVVFPLGFDALKDFLTQFVKTGNKSAISDVLSLVGFLQHVLGMSVEPGLLDHPWLKGILRGAGTAVANRNPSRVLTVLEVLCMEEALIEGHLDKVDRFALGVFLFQLYARARVSDIRSIARIVLDIAGGAGYIEVQTYEHKTKRITNTANIALLLIAPVKGLATKPWGISFISAAQDVGINFHVSVRGPLLPRLTCDYSWSGDAVGSTETTRWVNALLDRVLKSPVAAGFTSQGLKATSLSWMAKAGYPEETRRVLGHHTLGAGRRTLEAYSRDVQAAPLRAFEECLSFIRSGNFLPDMTRSGMIKGDMKVSDASWSRFRASFQAVSEPEEAAPAEHAKGRASDDEPVRSPSQQANGSERPPEPDATVDESSSSSDSSSSGSSDEGASRVNYSDFCPPDAEEVVPFASMGVDCDVFQNVKTKSLHARAKGSTGKLICGRSAEGLAPFKDKVWSRPWKCKQCMMYRPLRDASGIVSFLDGRASVRKP